jgi:hypothetical protein
VSLKPTGEAKNLERERQRLSPKSTVMIRCGSGFAKRDRYLCCDPTKRLNVLVTGKRAASLARPSSSRPIFG